MGDGRYGVSHSRRRTLGERGGKNTARNGLARGRKNTQLRKDPDRADGVSIGEAEGYGRWRGSGFALPTMLMLLASA